MKFLRIIVFLPLFCLGQETLKPSLGISAGCNISRHYLLTFPLDRGAGLNLGLNGLFPVRDVFCIKSSMSLSWMSSTWGFPFFKLRNQYVEFSLCAAAHFRDEIIFSAGINHSELLSSKILRLDYESNWQAYDINLYRSQQSIDIGMELKLQKNFSLLFDYFIPLKQFDTKNFRVGINVRLTGRSKKESIPCITTREKALIQINDLKNGVLLVRLHTSEQSVEAMKRAGREHPANKTMLNHEKENRKIISSFRKNFSFCPVMFFFSNNSEKIMQKNISGIFLNDSLQPDSSIRFDETKKYFIAEFTALEPDTEKYFSHYSHAEDASGNLMEVKNYYGAADFSYYALVIRDENFAQLLRPFPYYTNARPEAALMNLNAIPFYPVLFLSSLNWTYDAVVSRLEERLNNFYNENRK